LPAEINFRDDPETRRSENTNVAKSHDHFMLDLGVA
jgi:hypothetical protein